MKNMDKQRILSRFLEYVSYDTQSDDTSSETPSTSKQLLLAQKLQKELISIGLQNVELDQKGYVYALLPSNSRKKVPAVGFIAHIDTSPDMPGNNIRPKIIQNYNGNDIVLNETQQIVLKVDEYPDLKRYLGQTIITTDGSTLLGADDKAGIAAIMTAMEYLTTNPDIEHGDVYVAFTPDEEIGRGMDHFQIDKFKAEFAYTVDGGGLGELEYESFNAALATITIQGNNIHPGYGKNKLINALHIATEINSMLPPAQRPEHTTGYEGFFHLIKIDGTVEKATMMYLVRDHDSNFFQQRKEFIKSVVDFLNQKYGQQIIHIEMKDQYFNMREKIEPVYYVVEYAIEAMKQENIEPHIIPIRGGTDGSRLSFMGIPCPNIFAGGHNFHSKYEYVPLESIEKSARVILNIIQIVHQKS